MILDNLARVLVRFSEGDPDVVVLDQGYPDPGHEDRGLRGGDTGAQVGQEAALDERNTIFLALCCDNVDKLQSLLAQLVVLVFPANNTKF